MDLESVKKSLEATGDEATAVDSLPPRFYDAFVLNGLSVDVIEPGRVVCSMTVPPRFLNARGHLHGGVMATLVDLVGSAVFFSVGLQTSGVSLEINVSYVDAAFVDEEIDIEAKILRAGKAFAVSTVELRKRKTGKPIAQARHTKYLPASSKL